MTLLIYLLFLSGAANVLYDFPYNENIVTPPTPDAPYVISNSQSTKSNLAESTRWIKIPYIQWLALDIGIVWIYAITALHWPIWNYYYSSRNGHGSDQKTLLELMLPHQDVAYFTTSDKRKGGKKWYIFVFLGLSASTIFDVYTYEWWST